VGQQAQTESPQSSGLEKRARSSRRRVRIAVCVDAGAAAAAAAVSVSGAKRANRCVCAGDPVVVVVLTQRIESKPTWPAR
jgi:hypothetical protein